ncbi:MAG: Na(+)-translocating NADH-quinone reductase subunit A [Bacteroidales bacterium]|nr:Na(+)-translocating NADH-quinone reductase subunit A [Bacteroidales bacterium]
MNYKISKGLDIVLKGKAIDTDLNFVLSDSFYVKPDDFRWLKPKLLVNEGDMLEVGTPLFADKQDERIVIVSPIKGQVVRIVRGEKRAIQAVTLRRADETAVTRQIDFPEPKDGRTIRQLMLQYGLWPCLRQRPYATIPCPDAIPKSVFISCFDSSPLAPEYSILLRGKEVFFQHGISVLQMASEQAPIHLCMKQGADNKIFESIDNVAKHYFSGPHPAGNVGTQIHRIAPIDKGDVVWYLTPQEVARIGRFFMAHVLGFEQRAALTGPAVAHTGYFNTVYGADLSALFANRLSVETVRCISGNVLTGIQLADIPTLRFHDHQVTVVEEGGQREFIGWLLPGFKKWSFSHTYTSWLMKNKTYEHNTSLHGGRRTFMMTDVYDKVFPFDIIPLALLKACYVKDIEQMEELGIYEVDDEDFALCEVVCPSKMECQKIVRDALIELRMDN